MLAGSLRKPHEPTRLGGIVPPRIGGELIALVAAEEPRVPQNIRGQRGRDSKVVSDLRQLARVEIPHSTT
jgi:hypothetical protein